MRQLITRIDEDLHERLRARARAEHRSLASLVREALMAAVADAGDPTAVRERLERAGVVVRPDPPERVPTREEALEVTRGAGAGVSAALEADRAHR